ncbi:MAG: sugar ABC transporter ATP-binding protein [Eubacteriales bacterium]|nr:sugar ABC transporter ATP-binding protein [Eubacteriales bacterium]
MTDYLLELRGITKSFSGNRVLDDVTLRVLPGTVHALIGENGAGKSTLMKVLMGIYSADSGTIMLGSRQVDIGSPRQALDLGVQMIHQELSPVLDMTIAENLFAGAEETRKFLGIFRVVDRKRMENEAIEALAQVGLHIVPGKRMRALSIAQMQMVEIAKAISRRAKLIVMDEPTSALTEKETEILFDRIRALRDQGVSVIYISHKLEEISEISDMISILRDGRMIETVSAKGITRDYLISRMVGRELTNFYPKREVPMGDVLFEARGIGFRSRVKDVSFNVRRGEILGVAGLVGAGRSETMSALFGVLKKDAGDIYLNGRKAVIKKPSQAVAQGMAYITEDRKATGLNLIATIKHNITSVYLRLFTRRRLLNETKEQNTADKYIQMLKIRTESREKPVQLLSGGNQQKVAIAKWLAGDPDIIIMDEPTRGIDVGSMHDIYTLMGELAARGKAIIMVSSELQELMGMADRIMVLADSRVTGFIDRKDFDQEKILGLQFV